MKRVALITLHGMGPEKPAYYSKLEEGLSDRLETLWEQVAFVPVHYAALLQGPQDRLWEKLEKDASQKLSYREVRQFMLYGFGDAGSLEHSAARDGNRYREVQACIQTALTTALGQMGGDANRPVMVFAHSLGCQVISNYLWDADLSRNRHLFEGTAKDLSPRMEFLRLRTLRRLITTGCNIPLFIGGLEPRKCFSPPNPGMSWDNFYDPDDILGWPLRQLDPSYDLVRDRQVNVGGLLTSWNPLCHHYYWENEQVLDSMEASLRALL